MRNLRKLATDARWPCHRPYHPLDRPVPPQRLAPLAHAGQCWQFDCRNCLDDSNACQRQYPRDTTDSKGGDDMTTAEETLLIDVREVARLLTVSSRTVERMVDEGRFPQPVRMGGRLVRWPRASVVQWVASQAVTVDATNAS
jgi:prophage regulatory protein